MFLELPLNIIVLFEFFLHQERIQSIRLGGAIAPINPLDSPLANIHARKFICSLEILVGL